MTGFFAAVELFGLAWSTMLLAAVVLSVPGVMVVARGQIILAIAAAQAAACGAAAAMALIGWGGGAHVHGDIRIHGGALVGGLVGTAIAWRGSSERAGWLFAAASAGSLLLVAHSPYGMHDLLALQHSNALSAGRLEAWVFAVGLVVVAITIGRYHRELRLLAIDPAHARACGLAVGRWNLLIGMVMGLVISIAVSSLGLLFTFGCLVLPTLIAARVCHGIWQVTLLVPLIGLAGAAGGIVLGHQWDLPPGQTAVAVLVLALPLAAMLGWMRRSRWPASAAPPLDAEGEGG